MVETCNMPSITNLAGKYVLLKMVPSSQDKTCDTMHIPGICLENNFVTHFMFILNWIHLCCWCSQWHAGLVSCQSAVNTCKGGYSGPATETGSTKNCLCGQVSQLKPMAQKQLRG